MKIDFADLAGIIQSVRDEEDFDGKNDIHEFMDHLDDLADTQINVERIHGVVVYRIEREANND